MNDFLAKNTFSKKLKIPIPVSNNGKTIYNEKTITDFDCLIIATNSNKYYNFLTQKNEKDLFTNVQKIDENVLFSKINNSQRKQKEKVENSSSFPLEPYERIHFIIVESKSHLTLEEVKTKIVQKQILEQFIQNVKQGIQVLKSFDQWIQLGIKYFEDEVGLFIGGYANDSRADRLIESFIQSKSEQIKQSLLAQNEQLKAKQIPKIDTNHKSFFLGKIELTSSRFSVQDIKNIYNTDNVQALSNWVGGRQKSPQKQDKIITLSKQGHTIIL